MEKKEIKTKGLVKTQEEIEEALKKINEHTLSPLSAEDVFLFDIELCDNDIDRVGDKMSDTFLEQLAAKAVGLTGLKDHDWSSDNQMARLYDAEVVVDPGQFTQLGEPRKYVLGKAYTLKRFKDYIEKINAGLLKECSIAFESYGDTCSICGCPSHKGYDDRGRCGNNHLAGEEVDGQLCYTSINNLGDVLEWSLVAVPCQHKAGIKNKGLGGSLMSRTELLLRQFMNGKAFKAASKEEQEKIEQVLKESETEKKELNDEDIKGLISENEELKAKVKELEDKVADSENGRKRDKMEAIVSKAVDDMGPLTPKVKDAFMKEIPWDDLELEDGQIPGLPDIFAKMCKDYEGLFTTQSETEERGGHKEPDGDEAGVVYPNKKGEPDGDEGKLMVMDKGCGTSEKSFQPGLTVTKSTTQAVRSDFRPGLYFKQ